MSRDLVEPLDLRVHARREREFGGTLALSQLARLSAEVDSAGHEPITVHLSLALTATEQVSVTGLVTGHFMVPCALCAGPVERPVSLRIAVKSGDLPDGDFSLDDGPVRLADIVEDELMLELARDVRHPRRTECAEEATSYLVDEPTADVKTPFAGLKDLMAPKEP